MKKIYLCSFLVFIFIFLISCITTFVVYSGYSFTTNSTEYYFPDSDYFWPLPSHSKVSSKFGFRILPTTGASTYHSGIDIPAPKNTAIYSASSGTVSYLGFDGANGYTIQIKNGNFCFSYSHVSPKFMVKIGDSIKKSQQIGNVGPKYIDSIPNNPYKDSSRQTNKWCYNGMSFTFWRKNRWQSHRPTYFISLAYISSSKLPQSNSMIFLQSGHLISFLELSNSIKKFVLQ